MQPAFSANPQAADENAALRHIVEGTSAVTGKEFFTELVRNLAASLQVCGAWVTEYLPDERRLRAFAFLINGQWRPGYEYLLEGTPCAPVIDGKELVHFEDRIVDLFPEDHGLAKIGAVSYLAMPLLDTEGKVMGHLGVLDNKPMPRTPRNEGLLRIFAARATAEVLRLRAEASLQESMQKLGRLVTSAMDAIIEVDPDLVITLANPAAQKVLGCDAERLLGTSLDRFLAESSRVKLKTLLRELASHPEGRRYLWIPGGLNMRGAEDSAEFPAEATLSCSDGPHGLFYTLILRDVNERVEAERRIRSLSNQAAYLREELLSLAGFEEIVGGSEPLLRALHDVQQVAPSDATVLLLGETGTGKELFARAIHAASPRADNALITVNCAAIPTQLMESEFFGHERGAFTGATARREGRFALADGGTIFLDEVGELPLELQAKLLRVLQEGEFEPVGSSRTRKVNVRVLAATNRDLSQLARDGRFREDLYYRLNVFPIRIPPLRERGEDVVLLADAFASRFAKRMGRTIQPVSPQQAQRLVAYQWPGNVRELQNVIERAVITSMNGSLNLERALPDVVPAAADPESQVNGRVYTMQELEALERENLLRALESCEWRVAGDRGAARLLGINPSTLASRIKALGIERPR
jgi:PAS domain S-box-containing protein